VSLVGKTSTSVTVSWSSTAGATAYEVMCGSNVESVAGTTHTIENLSPGTLYEIKVRALRGETAYEWSPALTVTTENGPLTIIYSYDSFGRISSVAYPSGLTIVYIYDNMGNIVEISRNN
jgi:hypothetical protein